MKILYFTNKFNQFLEVYNPLLVKSEQCYNKKCCPCCGGVLTNELKPSIKCNECGESLLVRTEPINKSKVLISKEEKEKFEEMSEDFKKIKCSEEIILRVLNCYPQYKNYFKNEEEKKVGHNSVSIAYQFIGELIVKEELIAYNTYMKLSKNGTRIIDIRKIDLVTRTLCLLEGIRKDQVDLLFLEKKYNDVLWLLPLTMYRELTSMIFRFGVVSRNNITEEMLINSCNIYYNQVLKLLEEKNITIEDFKVSFFKYVDIKSALYPYKIEDAWDFIEKGIKQRMEWNKKQNLKP